MKHTILTYLFTIYPVNYNQRSVYLSPIAAARTSKRVPVSTFSFLDSINSIFNVEKVIEIAITLLKLVAL